MNLHLIDILAIVTLWDTGNLYQILKQPQLYELWQLSYCKLSLMVHPRRFILYAELFKASISEQLVQNNAHQSWTTENHFAKRDCTELDDLCQTGFDLSSFGFTSNRDIEPEVQLVIFAK
jgi:hypothetical protein